MGRPAIIEPAISTWVAEGRELVRAVNEAEQLAVTLEQKLATTREAARGRRIELGQYLAGVKEKIKYGEWGDFCEAIEISRSSAFRYMRDAGHLFQEEELKQLGVNPSEVGVEQPNAPPPTDGDAPAELLDQSRRTEVKANRDGWCTPAPIAKALPKKLDLDPCGNPFSIVVAKTVYTLEAGQNGLLLPWFGLVFVNGPYSDLLPFAEKLEAEHKAIRGAGFLVNADNSPAWWHVLTKRLKLRLDFDERQEFIPPPGVEPSKNDRPQTLLMDAAFWAACDQRALLEMGTLWKQVAA